MMRTALLFAFLFILAPSYAADTTVRTGTFYGGAHAPGDTASGTATVVKNMDGAYQLVLSDDFSTTPGPDLFVYLSAAAHPVQDADIKQSKFINVGKLASPSGNQTLMLPKDFDPAHFKSVAIWCKQFSVLFGAAALK
jgi:Electron transfer DM13